MYGVGVCECSMYGVGVYECPMCGVEPHEYTTYVSCRCIPM